MQTQLEQKSALLVSLNEELDAVKSTNARLAEECEKADQMEEDYIRRVQQLITDNEKFKVFKLF